jgi:hypothetical protein
MNVSRWWLANRLEIVVLPTNQSIVRIADPAGVALSLELVDKIGRIANNRHLTHDDLLNQLQIIFVFSNDRECPMDKGF